MHAWTGLLCLLAALAGAAPAQAPAAESQAALLAGPRVAETNVTAPNSTFVQPENQRQRLGAGVDPRVLRQFIAELRESNDPNLRLTSEQDAEIGEIARDYQARASAFERRGPGVARRLGGQGDQPADRGQPDRVADPMKDEQPTNPGQVISKPSATLIAGLEGGRPDSTELQKRLRAVLNQAQRQALDQRMEAVAKERLEQRQMEQIRKEVAAQMARQTPTQINLDRLPPRIRQRIESLPPEERAVAVERFLAQFAKREGAGRPSPETEKPAPSMDHVKVPRPGGG
ncbi:MAG: hypothetical protein KJZ65_07880 [Phycisphaerales bacterium]|nr:hypothetical protein [Phycisphaerales bacterium]